MKRTLLTPLCIVAVLTALCTHVPAARADETDDYVNQIYQDQQQLDDYFGSVDETQQYIDQIYQDQQERDDYLNSIWQEAQPPAPPAPVARPVAVPQAKAPVAGPVAVPQRMPFMFPAPAVAQRFPTPPDARQVAAFQQAVLRQLMQTQQLQRMQFYR